MLSPDKMSRNENYVINPESNRRIKIGSRTWMNLVKRGVMDQGEYTDPNTLYTIDEDQYETEEDIRNALYEEKARVIAEDPMPQGRRPVVKRRTLVYQRDKLTTAEASKNTANAALDVIDSIQSNRMQIPDDMNRDEARQYLQDMIFERMLSRGATFESPYEGQGGY